MPQNHKHAGLIGVASMLSGMGLDAIVVGRTQGGATVSSRSLAFALSVLLLAVLIAACAAPTPGVVQGKPSMPTALPGDGTQAGQVTLVTEPTHMELVRVPAGEFLMGSDLEKDQAAFDDEMPQHQVYLADFDIGRTEVTVAQFEAFVKATGYQTTAEKEGSGTTWTGSDWEQVEGVDWRHPRGLDGDMSEKGNHPVTQVSWYDALAFCQWAGLRLPTEAEWEKAARGADGRLYPWGDEVPDDGRCNFDFNTGDTMPVGSYPSGASPYGVLDMAGNVSEWTGSLWGKNPGEPDFWYPYNAGDGRENASAPAYVRRVLRGGSWFFEAEFAHAAYRDSSIPAVHGDDLGFRCARSG